MFLSIVAAFCDKDCQLIESLIDNIEKKVKVEHEIILIDNRENNHSEIDFKNAKVYSKGYNAYQFEARRYAVQFCSGEYIWFIDADDEIFTVDIKNNFTDDIICFNYAIKTTIVQHSPMYYYIEETFQNQFTHIYTKDIKNYIREHCSVWDLCGCTLWNKWIRKDLMEKVVAPLPVDEIIVASEDVLYCSLVIDRSDSICFCKDTIYLYKECDSMAYNHTITLDKFKHIIKGHELSSALFKKFIVNYTDYNDVYHNVSYFYAKAIVCEDTEGCFMEMLKHIPKKDLKKGLKHLGSAPLYKHKVQLLKQLGKQYL